VAILESIIPNQLNEAGRIGTAVRLDEIPAKYKHLKVIGRGATSIALKKDDHTAIILTRDEMKAEWLTMHWGLGLATEIDRFVSHKHVNRAMRELPIYVLKMPLLFPLSSENKRKVKQIMVQFEKIRYGVGFNRNLASRNQDILANLQNLIDDYVTEFDSEHQLHQLANFLYNYHGNQYQFDMAVRNFLQTADGEIVVIDPIVSSKLMDIFMDKKTPRW
jgi:hypothetical protein